jgi:hypothetical protein
MQRADKPHLLFHGAQSTLNSVVRLKTMRSVWGRKHLLLRRVGLAIRLMEVSGGMVGVRVGEQES